MSGIGWVGYWALVAGTTVGAASCSDEADGTFELRTWANDYSYGQVEIRVDGEPATSGYPTTTLKAALFDSYEEAIDVGVAVETWLDGERLDRCVLHAGACRGECTPERESAAVCVSPAGTLALMEWECPCDDQVTEYSCQYPCTLTDPD